MAELSQRTQLFGTLGSLLLLRLGCDWTLEDRNTSPREYPQISMFSFSGFPQLRRETPPPRPFVIPGKSSEFVQQCTWDAFPRAGATWPCIYSPTALILFSFSVRNLLSLARSRYHITYSSAHKSWRLYLSSLKRVPWRWGRARAPGISSIHCGSSPKSQHPLRHYHRVCPRGNKNW